MTILFTLKDQISKTEKKYDKTNNKYICSCTHYISSNRTVLWNSAASLRRVVVANLYVGINYKDTCMYKVNRLRFIQSPFYNSTLVQSQCTAYALLKITKKYNNVIMILIWINFTLKGNCCLEGFTLHNYEKNKNWGGCTAILYTYGPKCKHFFSWFVYDKTLT